MKASNPRLKSEAEEAEREMQEKRAKAQELQDEASKARASVPYLQLRAQVNSSASKMPHTGV